MITEMKFARASLSTIEADGTFSGYASLFGKADLGRDMVVPGAFRASLAKRGAAGVKMLFQHDPNQPIGVWSEIREDGQGLYVRGKLTTEVRRAREVLSLMRAGAPLRRGGAAGVSLARVRNFVGGAGATRFSRQDRRGGRRGRRLRWYCCGG
jgi:hypothetical protein